MDTDFNILTLPNSIQPTIFSNGLCVFWESDGPKLMNQQMEIIEEIHPLNPFKYKGNWYSYYVEPPSDETNINGRAVYLPKFDIDRINSENEDEYLIPAYSEEVWWNEEHDHEELLLGYKKLEEVNHNEIFPLEEFSISPIFREAREFNEGLAAVKFEDKWGYIDYSGNVAIDFRYDMAYDFAEDRAFVGKLATDQKGEAIPVYNWGIIDKSGNTITDFNIEYAGIFVNGYAIVNIDDGMNIINKDGDLILDGSYDHIEIHENDMVLIRDADKYFFLNLKTDKIIYSEIERAKGFNEGLAAILVNNRWGYINKEGSMVIEPVFNSANNFHDGFALVADEDNNSYLIDKKGEVFLDELDLKNISEFNENGYAMAYEDIADENGLPSRIYYIVQREYALAP